MADVPQAPLGVDGERFGEVAVREKFATSEQVRECAELQARLLASGSPPRRLGDLLVEKGYLTAGQADAISRLLAARNPAAHSSSKMMATVGFRIPGYELLERIGQGAMGSVFKARQLSMDRTVAVKVLNLKRGGDPSFIERFEREARSVGQLNHPNIIQGIEVGEANGLHYLVMEYVDGEPISSVLHRQGPMAEKRCVQIALQVARALDHASRHGVIHRDVKPENVMLTREGVAKLCDLGLAKQTRQEGANLTVEGITVGTPNYISPEQARGESNIDTRSDIYSLGATLYHMATGVPPFDGPNPMAIMTKHVTDPVDPPIRRVPGLSPGFNNLVLKMLMKRREDRYQDARQLIADLQLLQKGGPIAAPRTATRRIAASTARLPRRSSPLPYVLAACGALVAIVGTLWILKKDDVKAGADGAAPEVVPKKPGPAAEDSEETARCEREMREFRDFCMALWETREPGWIRQIYDRGEQRRRDYEHKSSEAEWRRLVGDSRARIDDWILREFWAPLVEEAEAARSKKELVKAIEVVRRMDPDLVHFRAEGVPVLTKAGTEQKRLLERLESEKDEAYRVEKNDVVVLWNQEQFEESFAKIAGMARRYGGGEDIRHLRKQGLQKLIDSVLAESPTAERFADAQQRLRSLRLTHAEDAEFVGLIGRFSEELKTRASDTAFDAAARLPEIYQRDFEPSFTKALGARDLLAARRLLFEVYLGETYAPIRPALPLKNIDPSILGTLLDPDRVKPGDYPVGVQASEAMARTARIQNAGAAFDLALDLRAYVLLEELIEKATYGAETCGKNTSRFAGFGGELKGVIEVETRERGEGGLWRLWITKFAQEGVKASRYLQLAPIGKEVNASEEEILQLYERSYTGGREKDPYFPLRIGLLYFYRKPSAEAAEWIRKVTQEPATFGIERYLDRLKQFPSPQLEAEAKSKYEAALRQYTDEKGKALPLLSELRDHYAETAYLKSYTEETGKNPPKLRLQVVLDCIRDLEKAKKKPKIGDLFKGVTRSLPGGRIEVTYDFVAHPEGMEDFEVTNWVGAVTSTKSDRGGACLQGNLGFWYWKAPLDKNVTLKAVLRIGNDRGVGAILHGDGVQGGYPGIVDFQSPDRGLQEYKDQSILFRLPIEKPQEFSKSIIDKKRGVRLKKGDTVELRYIREGKGLTLAVGDAVAVEHRDGRYDSGQAGLFIWGSDVVVQTLSIVGEPNKAWVDRKLKDLEK